MASDAVSRGARGAGVTVVGQGATMAVQFVGAIILSRLLTPSDYGLIAMVTVFMTLGNLIRDFGMPLAALQARELSGKQATNIFWVTAGLSGTATIVLAAATPLIVMLYDEPRLSVIVPSMAGILLITGLQAQFQVRLARQMRFKALALSTFASACLGISAGIVGALLGWGYWSLVAQQTTAAVVLLVFNVIQSRWLPGLPRREPGTGRLIRSGRHFGFAQIFSYAADNADTFVIGARYSSDDLGEYNRAFQLFMQPLMSMFGPLTKVVVPAINRAVQEGRSSSELLVKLQSTVSGVATWVLVVTAATADWLIPLLIGEQWTGTVRILQILALGGIMRTLSQVNYWAFIIEQKSKELLISNLFTKPFQVVLMIAGALISVEAVAWGFVIGRVVTWPFNVWWLKRSAGINAKVFALNGARIVLSAGASFFLTYFFLVWLDLPSRLGAVAVGVVVCTFVYFGLLASTSRGRRELVTGVRLMRRIVGRKGIA